MKLPGRRKRSKQAKALDAAASLAKTWMEAKAVKSAGKGVAKGAGSTRVRAIGAVALVGGAAAAVVRKLKGGGEPDPFATPLQDPPDAASTTNGGGPPAVAAVPQPIGLEPEPAPGLPAEPQPGLPESEPKPDAGSPAIEEPSDPEGLALQLEGLAPAEPEGFGSSDPQAPTEEPEIPPEEPNPDDKPPGETPY